jgi:DNA-binding winged helix-turn-helix (wHTH) protein
LSCEENIITLLLLRGRDGKPAVAQIMTIKNDSQAMRKETTKRYYDFGNFRIDIRERVLFNDKEIVPLTPKAFDTLLVLVENSGHVLSKGELMERVWPDSFVEENNLAQNISLLRKALGEEGGRKMIETVPKRGYRFVADVRESLGRTEGKPETWLNDETQAGCNEQLRQNSKSLSRDLVIIGRAIDFK